MNYTVMGSDGQAYGPADAARVREWIRQGRVDNRTAVLVAGAAEWTFLGLLPEFAADFGGAPPVISPLKSAGGPAPVLSEKSNSLATWGFICGLLSWTLCGCCVPFSVLGLVLSIIGLTQVNASGGKQDGQGFAIAGIALSALNLLWSLGLTAMSFIQQPSPLLLNFPH